MTSLLEQINLASGIQYEAIDSDKGKQNPWRWDLEICISLASQWGVKGEKIAVYAVNACVNLHLVIQSLKQMEGANGRHLSCYYHCRGPSPLWAEMDSPWGWWGLCLNLPTSKDRVVEGSRSRGEARVLTRKHFCGSVLVNCLRRNQKGWDITLQAPLVQSDLFFHSEYIFSFTLSRYSSFYFSFLAEDLKMYSP